MVQGLVQRVVKGGNPVSFRGGNSVPGKHDAVVGIAADYVTRLGIDDGCVLSRVELRQKLGQIPPLAVPRRPKRPADSEFDIQLRGGFPAILRKQVQGGGHPRGVGFDAELFVIVEVPQNRVGDCQPGGVGRAAGIVEREVSILIDGGAAAGRGCLNRVILAGMLDVDAPLDGVVPYDLGGGIGQRVKISGPEAGIGTCIERS